MKPSTEDPHPHSADMGKRATTGDEHIRPQKRRSRDQTAIDNNSNIMESRRPYTSSNLSSATTLATFAGYKGFGHYSQSQDIHDNANFVYKEKFGDYNSWAVVEPSVVSCQTVPTDADTIAMRDRERSEHSAKFGLSIRRRLSESLSRRTRKIRDTISAQTKSYQRGDEYTVVVERPATSARERAKSFSTKTPNAMSSLPARPILDYRGPLPPTRTSSLDQAPSRDPSPGAHHYFGRHNLACRNHPRDCPSRRNSSMAAQAASDSDRESGIIIMADAVTAKAHRRISRISNVGRVDPFDKLPGELLVQVFCHLEATHIVAASLVSKRWHGFTKDQQVLMNTFLRRWEPKPVASELPWPVGGKGIGLSKKAVGPRFSSQQWQKMYSARLELERNWRSGKAETKYLFGHTDSVYCVQFDEHKAITGSRDRTIRVWDLHTMSCIKVIGGPNAYEQDRRSLTNIPEFTEHMHKYLEKGGRCRWHLYPDKSVYHVPAQHHCASILCLQYDDEIMVTGSSDSTLIVWDIKTFEPLHVLRKHRSGVLDLAFDADKIVSCSKDFTICVWDRRTGAFLHQIAGHQGPVNAVQLRGNLVVSASGEGSSHLYNLNFVRQPAATPGEPDIVKVSPQLVNEFWSRDRGLACIEFSDDARHVLAGGNDHLIFKYDTSTVNVVQSMSGHEGLVRSLYLDGANGRIISGSYDMSVKVWDFATGDLINTFENRTTSWMLSAKSDYRRIVATSQDGRVALLDFGHGVKDVDLLQGERLD